MKQSSENTFGYEWQICQFGAQGIIDGVDYSRRNRDCRDLSDGFGAEGAGLPPSKRKQFRESWRH